MQFNEFMQLTIKFKLIKNVLIGIKFIIIYKYFNNYFLIK